MPTSNSQKTELINNLLARGVEEVMVYKHLEARLLGGKKLRIKFGIDPTGPKIHLGRASTIWKLREFQELGHKIVLIIGDFTAQIGDPSDKLSKRPMLTHAAVMDNLKEYREQLGKILDLSKVEWRHNNEWLSKLSLRQIAELAESFSFQQMAARRNFKNRLANNQDISLREFLYPMMQGYDSVVVKADVELGGSDQLFNLLAGRQVQKHFNLPEQDIITTVMLEGTDGRKMSTSWGNVINISDEPNDMYGKLMSIKDELIPKYLLLATRLPQSEINILVKGLKQGVNPKSIKTRLAYEVVAIYYNTKIATTAQAEFERVHKRGEPPTNMPNKPIPSSKQEMFIIDLLIYLDLVVSKGDAKRLITQGGVKIGGKTIKDWQAIIQLKNGLIVQIGNRRFAKLN